MLIFARLITPPNHGWKFSNSCKPVVFPNTVTNVYYGVVYNYQSPALVTIKLTVIIVSPEHCSFL